MPLDNLTDLLVFIRVADACSFTLAAERLGISRSAAGKCVIRLEERLATRLLQRTTRSVSLTEDGAVFYEYAQRILSQAEEAETALNTRRQTPRGRLRLDLPVSLGRLHILPILREFLAQWPEVDADVSFSDDYSDLVRDGIDVAVRVGGNDDSRLVRRVLAPHRLITCAAPDYLARHGTPAKPEALGDHETLVFSHQGLPAPWRYLVNGQLHEQPVRGRMRFNNVEALRDAAVAGAGLCQVGAFL
ncbi:LysR family transcriptional regulator, partial [Serratia marcescens]